MGLRSRFPAPPATAAPAGFAPAAGGSAATAPSRARAVAAPTSERRPGWLAGTGPYNATAAGGRDGTGGYLRLAPLIRQPPPSLTSSSVARRSLPDHVLFTIAVAVAPLTVIFSTVAS
jgi:hypothetical protein